MKVLKPGYIVQMALVAAVILIAGTYELPKYTSRLILLAVMALIDMRYWYSVRKHFTPRLKSFLTIAYWLPLWMLLSFLIAGIIIPFPLWNPFLRIYLPGVLLILLIGKGIFLTLLIASDIFIIPLNAIRQINSENIARSGRWYRPRSFLLTIWGISTIVMLTFFSGMFLWVRNYRVETVELQVKNLPVTFDGYKIVQISDMHLGTFLNTDPLVKIVNMVNDQHPDLILFTGDMVNFTTYEVLPFEDEMMKFSAKDGIYSILGNHDYGEYSKWDSQEAKDLNNEALFEFYDRIGWHLLRNQHAEIKRNSDSIAILGVENWSVSSRFGKKGDLKKALAGADSTQFKILMTHDPSHWDAEVNTKYPGIALTLSGHTHEFQIAIETPNIKWSPASLLFKEWAGLYEMVHKNGVKQYLYVNRGAGTLGYPGRIFSRPEITVIVLRNAG